MLVRARFILACTERAKNMVGKGPRTQRGQTYRTQWLAVRHCSRRRRSSRLPARYGFDRSGEPARTPRGRRADTEKWEQTAAYLIDRHSAVAAFVKNAGLGFAIPYLHNGQDHDYYPDFLIRLKCAPVCHVILETKGYDPLEEVKRAAAERWIAAVNAEGSFGHWQYVLIKKVSDIGAALNAALANVGA
jgi:hypothetical protein